MHIGWTQDLKYCIHSSIFLTAFPLKGQQSIIGLTQTGLVNKHKLHIFKKTFSAELLPLHCTVYLISTEENYTEVAHSGERISMKQA